MRMLRSVLVLASLASAWPGSGPKVSPRESAETSARAKYPASQYFWAVGESETSPEEAESRARIKVAEQIDLSIQSTLTNLVQEEQGSSASFYSKVVMEERKQTQFDNAQIIQCEPALKTENGWIVVASLSRLVALNALTQSYEDSARRFRSRTASALDAPNISTFTVPWREATRIGRWLKLQGVRFLSISGTPISAASMGPQHPHAPEYPSDMALLDRLDSARSAFLARQQMSLSLEALPNFIPQASQALKQSGISVVVGAADWTISVRMERANWESAFGEIHGCRLTPILNIRHVSGTVISTSALSEASGEGYKLRDPDGACADAQKKLDLAPLEPSLQELLRSTFPIL